MIWVLALAFLIGLLAGVLIAGGLAVWIYTSAAEALFGP